MRACWMWLGLLAACDDTDGPSVVADAAVDVANIVDAPAYQCYPPDPLAPGPACLALELAALEGSSPLGVHAMYLQYVGAGDCITLSQMTLSFGGACGETLAVQFSYPVMSGADSKRFVPAGGFDRTARILFDTPDRQDVMTTTPIHVDVVQWQEGDGVHDIDITVTFTETGYSIPPIHVSGTFCDWPYQLC